MNLIKSNEPVMTGAEIAELVESRHDSVKRAIERLASEKLNDDGSVKRAKVIELPPMVGVKNHLGQTVSDYVFSGEKGRRDSIIVVAQLSPQFTARLVDRWQELEMAQKPQMPAIPQTYAEALQLAADQARLIEEQRPKVEVYEKLAERKGDVSTTILAKQLGVSAIKLNQWLREKGMKWKNADLPMAGYMDWFNVVADVKNGHEYSQCLITPLGQIEIAKRFTKH